MKKHRGTLVFLYRTAGRIKLQILVLLAEEVLIGLCGIFYALFLRNIIDAAAGGKKEEFLFGIAGFFALLCAQLVLAAAERYLAESVKSGLENRLKRYLYECLLDKDYQSVTAVHSGEWMNRLTNDTVVTAGGMAELLPGACGMIVRLAGALVLISVLEPGFLWIILPCGAVLLLISTAFRRIMKELHRKVQEADGRLRIYLQETLESLLVVHSYSVEKTVMFEADRKMQEHRKNRTKRSGFSVLCSSGFGLLVNLAYVFGAFYCGLGILNGTMSYGTFTAVLQLVGQIQSPFAGLSGLMPRYYTMMASAERIMEADQLERREGEPAVSVRRIRELYETRLKALCITDGSFTYCPPAGEVTQRRGKEKMPVILSGLDLQIRKGEYVAFTGPSGCGKSTVLKLLMCLFPLDGGERYLLTSDGREPLTPALQRLFAYVPQGNFLMSGTIRDIISLADREGRADTERIRQALQISCADTFVDGLENGVDTVLGEKGLGLSEGQMQRIAIARAVYSDHPVLLLDECTSALDAETEKRLLGNLKRMTDKTVILVTHRPEALKICDQHIVFSEEGKVIHMKDTGENKI